MKKQIFLFGVMAALALAGGASARAEGAAFLAILSGDNEVPANNSVSRGIAIFRLADDGTTVHYTLIVANLKNPVAAHIHTGAAGVNGPVVVPLFNGPPAGGRFSGILAEGTFTATPELLADLAGGNMYVNVHTNDGVAPPGTGPGDIPSGEIRGQVFAVSEEE
ncbi:MAG: CHRD domain-containing protein [Verrucomicrobiota bacterium]